MGFMRAACKTDMSTGHLRRATLERWRGTRRPWRGSRTKLAWPLGPAGLGNDVESRAQHCWLLPGCPRLYLELTYSLKEAKALPIDHAGWTRLERAGASLHQNDNYSSVSASLSGHWIDETGSRAPEDVEELAQIGWQLKA